MKKILFWGLLLLAAACSRSSEEPDSILSPNTSDPSPSWVRSPEDALESLVATLENLEGSESTRAASVRQIRSVETVKMADVAPSTRSGAASDTDDIFYLVSFGDGNGSAILGADRRLPSVLAVLDETVLTPDDLTYSEEQEIETPQDFVLSCLVGSAISTMAIDPPSPDIPNPFDPNPWTPMKPRPHTEVLVSCNKRQEPLLKTRWGQGSPYNKYCLGCPAGCGPIAVGQFLTFWSLPDPNVVGNQTFDWNLIRMNSVGGFPTYRAEDEAARYVQTLGVCLKAKYTSTKTSVKMANVEGFLRGLVFPDGILTDYDAITAERMVFAGRPVIMSGQGSGGHAWILDGWYRYEAKKCTWVGNEMVSAEPIQDILTHCNFGWAGINDGYYSPWVFDTYQRKDYDSETGDGAINEWHYYNSELEMFVY